MTTIDTHADSAAPAGAGLTTVAEWITTTDHKRIGRLYLGTAALTGVGSVTLAALLAFERIDAAKTTFKLGSLTQMFSLYRFGLTYLVMLPLVVGVALAVVPLQVGARAIAFPRLAALGFWAWLVGAALTVASLVGNGGPSGGNARFVDLFTLAAALCMAGLLASTLSLVATVLTTRVPGMNMRRVPLFSWSVLVMGLGLVVVLPIVIGLLLVVYVAHKYPSLSELSGNRALPQWVGFGFTQPTTILFAIPVLGLLADTVATATRSRLRPRGPLLAAVGLVGTAMFGAAVQAPVVIRAPFRDLSGGDRVSDLLPYALVHVLPLLGVFLAVALTVSALRTKPKVTAPLVFALLGALLVLLGTTASALFHIGDAGLTGTVFEEGVWLALVYGTVLGAMGAVAYWGPKLWGRSMPRGATLPLALVGFVGALLASVPMLIAGFADQPGAVFPAVGRGDSAVTFSYSGPHGLWNGLSFAGHVVVLVTVLAFVALALRSFLSGERVGDDPWDGGTLEWATTSPAPADNFAEILIVKSAEPLLDLKPSRSDA